MSILALAFAFLPQQAPEIAGDVLERHRRAGDFVLDAEYRRSLQIALTTWAVEGTVRRLEDELERFRIDGKVVVTESDGSTREKACALWRRGEAWYFLDKDGRTWCRGEGPGLGGEWSAALYGLYDLAFSDAPERNAFEPGSWSDGGRTRFAGELCRTVLVRTASGAEQRWLVGMQDRRPVSIHSEESLPGADRLFETWSKRRMRPRRVPEARVDPIDFRAEGYEETPPVAVGVDEAFGGDAGAARTSVFSLAGGIEPFRRRFDGAASRPRAIGLFGPT